VEGLTAKPIVDLAVTVRSFATVPANVAALDLLDYDYVPEYESQLPQRRYFRSRARGSTGDRLFHVHVYESGHADVADHLAFRDHLRAHPGDARVYEALKSFLAREFSREDYSVEKSSFIRGVLAAARGKSNPLGPPDVILVENDPRWRASFEEERALLREVLGGGV